MADAKEISERLLRRYPEPKLALRVSDPPELLVATILSTECTEVRVNEVTRALLQEYRSAEDYAGAALATFAQEIRPIGFYRSKAKTTTACCRQLVDDLRVNRNRLRPARRVGERAGDAKPDNALALPNERL